MFNSFISTTTSYFYHGTVKAVHAFDKVAPVVGGVLGHFFVPPVLADTAVKVSSLLWSKDLSRVDKLLKYSVEGNLYFETFKTTKPYGAAIGVLCGKFLSHTFLEAMKLSPTMGMISDQYTEASKISFRTKPLENNIGMAGWLLLDDTISTKSPVK